MHLHTFNIEGRAFEQVSECGIILSGVVRFFYNIFEEAAHRLRGRPRSGPAKNNTSATNVPHFSGDSAGSCAGSCFWVIVLFSNKKRNSPLLTTITRKQLPGYLYQGSSHFAIILTVCTTTCTRDLFSGQDFGPSVDLITRLTGQSVC